MYGNPGLIKGRPPTGSLANRPSRRGGAGRIPPTAHGNVPKTGTSIPEKVVESAQTEFKTNPPKTGFRFMIANRPTTQQGMGGIRGNLTGPGRQVQDASFYQLILRQKLNSIVEETKRLNQQLDNTAKENSNYLLYEQKADELAEELRLLQGQLGDYNTLVDKLRANAAQEDFERDIVELKEKNESYSQAMDKVLLDRKAKETLIGQMEDQISEKQQKDELLIKTLDPTKQNLFKSMKQENQGYVTAMEEMQEQLDKMSNEYALLLEKIGDNPIKQKAVSFYQRLAKSKEKRAEHELAIQKSGLESGAQERARLLEQVKNDNLESTGMEQKIAELERNLGQLKKDLEDKDTNPAQVERQAKFEELVKRDREMQEFMDAFPMNRHEIYEQSMSAEADITDILTKIQKLSQITNNLLPSKENYAEAKTALAMKSKDLQNSTSTIGALTNERNQRLQDLEKVEQLESKLSLELESLDSKIGELNTALTEIGDVDRARTIAKEKISQKTAFLKNLKAQEDASENQLQEVLSVYNVKRSALGENDIFNDLSRLEAKSKEIESNNVELRESMYYIDVVISEKNSKCDYTLVKQEVLDITQEINDQLVKITLLAPAAR